MAEKKSNAKISAFGSEMNSLDFFIRALIKTMVSTSIPVRVDAVERGGEGGAALYVDVTPMVTQTDAEGNSIPPVTIPHLPYFRYQHGTAAVICDPKVGDLGLAVFAQQDCSRLTGDTTPQAPGTFRCFDMSDGFYVGGFWGQVPKTFIHIEDEGTIHVVAPKSYHLESPKVIVDCDTAQVNAKTSVTVVTQTAKVNASSSLTVDSPQSTFTGNVSIKKNLTVTGHISGSSGMSISGGTGGATATFQGSIQVSDDVTASNISLKSHTHTGVHGETSGPH
nr:MAG TPA: baseplate protein [Caudoviricetes sp.]